MKTVYDKNGNQAKIIEQSDVNGYQTIVGDNGVTVIYNESLVTIVLNSNISKINGGNVLNNDIISLPNGVTARREFWHTLPLLSSAWVPTNNNAYFSYENGTSRINIRTTTTVENVVMVGAFSYPRSFFNIS